MVSKNAVDVYVPIGSSRKKRRVRARATVEWDSASRGMVRNQSRTRRGRKIGLTREQKNLQSAQAFNMGQGKPKRHRVPWKRQDIPEHAANWRQLPSVESKWKGYNDADTLHIVHRDKLEGRRRRAAKRARLARRITRMNG